MKNLDKLNRGGQTVTQLLKYKAIKKPIPLLVHIQITKRCNLKCIYCYVDSEKLVDTPDLTYQDYIYLIDELNEMGTKWIRFLGGEPLLRDDIGQMVDYARDKGMITEMNTNGYFMKQRGYLIKNLDSLVVSIDGAKETTDQCRGQGTYDRAIEAIEIAKDLGMSVRLHGCLSKHHKLEDIDHLAHLAVKYGTAFNFSAPSPIFFQDDQRMTGHPSQEQVKAIHQRCVELKETGYPLTNTDTAAEYVKKWPNPDSDVLTKEDIKNLSVSRRKYVPCTAGKLYCTVDVDGNVYACASLWRNALNYKEVGFKKAWKHLNNLGCLSCNYIANIELNLLLGLSPKTLFEVSSYVLGRTAKKRKQLTKIQ